MKVIETSIEGCYIIEPKVFGDNRGYFTETYSKEKLKEYGIGTEFVQDNQSFSAQIGTLRGLHLQNNPMSQAKLVRCTQGTVFDVAVDLRKDSPTYMKWFGAVLSAENHRQLFIPRGCAHGFQTLTNDVIFQYKVDNYYSKQDEGGILWNDPEIGVDWPLDNPVLSDKDKVNPVLRKVIIK